ncbi:MAG: hypothetical protein ABJC26_11400 [Gemmatimonadaceae bacterium]
MRNPFGALLIVIVNLFAAGLATTPAVALAQERTNQEIIRDASFWRQPAGAVRVVLMDEMKRAILAQRAAWEKSELQIHGAYDRGTIYVRVVQDAAPGTDKLHAPIPPEMQAYVRRLANSWCWPNGHEWVAWNVEYTTTSMIRSSKTRYAVCPDWILPPYQSMENVGPLIEHSQLVPFPRSLEHGLDSAAQMFPREVWFIDQLVRITTENSHTDVALSALSRCNISTMWCGMLRAYTHFANNELKLSDSLFRRAVGLLPAATQCDWQSTLLLLDDLEARLRSVKPCAERAKSDSAIWWLATPLFSEGLNSRLLTHYARLIRATLEAELPIAAQHDLRADKGADAVATLHLRYGWPNRAFYVGPYETVQHSKSLSRDSEPPYPVPEYDIRRSVATFPNMRAARAPFTLADSDYQLMAPTDSTRYKWWPVEHFQHPNGAVIAIAQFQSATLKRDSTAVTYFATMIRGGMLDSIGDAPISANFTYSTAPGSIRIEAQNAASQSGRLVMHGELGKPGIASFEILVGAHGVAGARSRIGFATVPTLAAMPAGSCEISLPMLTDASFPNEKSAEPYAAMLGDLRLNRPKKVGLLWENYGFRANDSATYTIHVTKVGEISRTRRLGIALRIADDPTGSVTINWSEPSGPYAASSISNRFAANRHELALDISRFKAGDYVVQIMAEKRGCAKVQSERAFSIVR